MKRKLQRLGFPLLAVLLAAVFPSIFLYCNNADEAGFGEIVPALLVFCTVGIIFFMLSFIVVRKANMAAIIATLFTVILSNFAFLEKGLKLVFPSLKYWHTAPVIMVLGFHIAYALWRFLPEDFSKDVVRVLCLVFGALITINVVMGAPHMIAHMRAQKQLKEYRSLLKEQRAEAAVDLPNVYLLLYDEYANFPQIEEYYHYDNAPLKDFLTEHGFSISYTGHNESIISSTVQTNLVNLDYIVDNTTSESEKEVLRKQGRLFTLLREKGYTVRIFETGNFYGGYNPVSGTANGAAGTINGENLLDICVKQTIIYPFWNTNSADSIRDITGMTDYLSAPNDIPMGGTFTLAYFNFPHQPFVVDENGGQISAANTYNWYDDQYYLGQYKYATKLMLEILENILENDPAAIVLLQSDHGARATTDELFMEKFPLEAMNSSLNAVYFQGSTDINIEGLSLVNTLRTVLNRILDLDYEILPVPEDTYQYK